jgi:hypothetical protein
MKEFFLKKKIEKNIIEVKKINLFLKMGLKLKHDIYNNNIKIPPLIK